MFPPRPLISVVIPYYKGERFIGETLRSIFKQNYSPIEVIVVNDGSPEEFLSVFAEFVDKITLIHQDNKGQSVARNIGIRHARGELIALLDQDDVWPDGRLELMTPFLLEGEDFDFVRGWTQKFYYNSVGEIERTPPIFHEDLVGSVLYKAIVFDKVGLFDESMREGEDFDWNIRLRESGCREKRITDTTLFYRRHDYNLSDVRDFVKNGQFQSLKRKLDRARESKKQHE